MAVMHKHTTSAGVRERRGGALRAVPQMGTGARILEKLNNRG